MNKQNSILSWIHLRKEVAFTIQNTMNKKPSQEQQDELDAKISFEELTIALKSLKNNKIPVEFYKIFLSKIGQIYFTVRSN